MKGYSQILLNSRQATTINLAFNRLNYLEQMDSLNRELIGTKEAKISILQYQFDLRSEQLISANTQIAVKEKEIKKVKRQLIIVKSASILAILGTIYFFK